MESFKAKLRLSKLRGQHFLTDKTVVAKIIKAGELTASDLVLEVGPGLGVMTRDIFPLVKQLVAVELDPLFVRELNSEFGDEPKIEIIEGDILRLRISDVIPAEAGIQSSSVGRPSKIGPPMPLGGDGGYKLITNLPYNITSAFLKKFLLEPPHPERIVIMIQKEVAERIVSLTPNPSSLNPSSGMLGLMCNLYAACSWVGKVGAGSFAPPPKVDSAVIVLKPYSERAFAAKWGFEHGLAEDFLSFCQRFFAQPRKKMTGALAKPLVAKLRLALAELEESPDSRPAVLALEKWVALWKKMK